MSSTEGYVKICRVADVDSELGLRVDLPNHEPLAVWRVDADVFVTDDTCTHGQASLVKDGVLDGFVIECGIHRGAFDIRSGKVESPPCKIPLKVHPSLVLDDEVWAQVIKEGDTE